MPCIDVFSKKSLYTTFKQNLKGLLQKFVVELSPMTTQTVEYSHHLETKWKIESKCVP